jgi:hypothetical protein
LQLTIDIAEVVSLHPWIESAMEDVGAPLFFESNGLHALNAGVWDAIFYFTLRAEIPPESVPFAEAPGVKTVGKPLRIA